MNKLKQTFRKIKQFFLYGVSKRNGVEDDYSENLKLEFEALKYWTPELIEWIGNEKDAVKLSVASCLVNCGRWPEWLPGKPKEYIRDCSVQLHYRCEVIRILENKSEQISKGLNSKIWLTKHYDSYVC